LHVNVNHLLPALRPRQSIALLLREHVVVFSFLSLDVPIGNLRRDTTSVGWM
jgi:hypothetical protein